MSDQIDYIALFEKHGGKRPAAKALGIAESTFRYRLKEQQQAQKLNKLGLKMVDADALAKAEQDLHGTSTLVNEHGDVVLKWIKTNKQAKDVAETLKSYAEILTHDIPAKSPVELKGDLISDEQMAAVYTLSDFHMGMYANALETGDDWDLEKAKHVFKSFIYHSIQSARHCSHAVLLNLGDMSHTDGNTPHTTSRKHAIDVSCRFNEIRDAIVECFDYAIEQMLEVHETVHLIYCRGNHDDHTSPLLRDMIARAYRNDPRITVDRHDGIYHAHHWGLNAFFATHGHKRTMKQAAETFISQYAEVYGNTKFRYGFVGHRHHEKLHGDEYYGVKMRQFDTLAPLDAHAAEGGYYSDSRSCVMFFHKYYGYRGEASLSTEMLTDRF